MTEANSEDTVYLEFELDGVAYRLPAFKVSVEPAAMDGGEIGLTVRVDADQYTPERIMQMIDTVRDKLDRGEKVVLL